MARLMTPGLKFFAERIDPLYPPTGLYPTMSTYQYGFDLEGGPVKNELYVVCQNGTIQSVNEPNRPIGWELIEEGSNWYYRVTQMNHPRKRAMVTYHSRVEDPPEGRGPIGSVVVACRRTEDLPQNAEVTEQKDDGEEVISSQLEKIATIDPLLAQCAVIVNDPVQTAAMAKFAEGEMSYAEVRGLCG